jgi:hypothetical protein
MGCCEADELPRGDDSLFPSLLRSVKAKLQQVKLKYEIAMIAIQPSMVVGLPLVAATGQPRLNIQGHRVSAGAQRGERQRRASSGSSDVADCGVVNREDNDIRSIKSFVGRNSIQAGLHMVLAGRAALHMANLKLRTFEVGRQAIAPSSRQPQKVQSFSPS